MIGYIYKITNLTNGKIYIGQTAKSIEQRYKEHLFEAFTMNTQRPLYKALRRYGSDNFKVECIEETELKNLNERETFYIKEYNCLAICGNGYNVTYGGEGKRVDYDLIRQLWDSGLCIKEICEETNFGRYGVNAALRNYENYSVAEARRRGAAFQNTARCRYVYQYSADGKFIKQFNSVFDAARELQCNPGGIRAALENPGSASHGFQWTYVKADKINPLEYNVRKYNSQICEITKSGEIINTYDSATCAANTLGLKAGYVRDACRAENHKYRGKDIYFRYYGGDSI